MMTYDDLKKAGPAIEQAVRMRQVQVRPAGRDFAWQDGCEKRGAKLSEPRELACGRISSHPTNSKVSFRRLEFPFPAALAFTPRCYKQLAKDPTRLVRVVNQVGRLCVSLIPKSPASFAVRRRTHDAQVPPGRRDLPDPLRRQDGRDGAGGRRR